MAIDLESFANALSENVWFELAFLLVVALFSSFLFTRLGQSKSIGYIIIGVLIGPSALGIIKGTDQPETIEFLALLGSLVLLFVIGLEADLRQIYTKRSMVIALGGSILPWIAGYLVAQAFGFEDEAIFIGATLVATSVAITASVISELGIIGTEVSYAILGAAVVDDVIGMIVLAISNAMVADTGAGLDIAWVLLLIIGAVLFVGLGGWLGSKYLAKLVFNVQVRGYRNKMPHSGFVLAFAILFLFSIIAETIGISAIVGAFVAGTIFSGSALRDGLKKGSQYIEAIFVPVFFVLLGTVVDLREWSFDLVWFALGLTGVAVLTKVVGCGLPAKAMGMSRWDSISVGLGMTPRLEVALIIAYYGFTQGIILEDVYSVVVFMALMTAVFTPTLLKWTLKKGKYMAIES
ncbi:MAG: cation:proton antiporter [Thermoplasmata archaeon]|jgi:Kef-type K+ transport system membrane component KefB|nr:cation:proton antiporter [Thermoplasmata archaeon]